MNMATKVPVFMELAFQTGENGKETGKQMSKVILDGGECQEEK